MKSYVVGIDIGGTNTKLGIVDSRGTVLAKDSIKTNKHQCVEDYIEDLHKAFTALTRANGLEGEIGGRGVRCSQRQLFQRNDRVCRKSALEGDCSFCRIDGKEVRHSGEDNQ